MNKLEQAMEDQKQGKWQQADKIYEEILQEEPENYEVMYILAVSKYSQNQIDEAEKIIDKAIQGNPSAPAYLQTKGMILAKKGETEEAIQVLSKALKENPNLYHAHIIVGHLNYLKGIKSEAVKHFKMAIKVDAKQIEGHVNLAKSLIDDGETKEAINLLREVEIENPEQAAVKMMMGQAFLENGAYSYAENYFQKVLAMHPENELAGLYLGIAKLQTGDIKNADKLIHAFNRQNKNNREGHAALGLYMFKLNKYKMAVEYLTSALERGVSPLSWKIAYVESLSRLGQIQPAVDFYQELANKADNKEAEHKLGELYEQQGKYKKAKKQYKKAEQNDSKYIPSRLGLSRCYLAEEKNEKAQKTSEQILQTHTNHAEATWLLLISLLKQNNETAAIEELKVIDFEVFNESYRQMFPRLHGMILDKQKQYPQAMQVFLDNNKSNKHKIPEIKKISEKEIQEISKFVSKHDEKIKEPVFIVGTQSTLIHPFVQWLYQQGIMVLNDRLVSKGRPDILWGFREVEALAAVDDEMVSLERELYQDKAMQMTKQTTGDRLLADAMYVNPHQLAIVKKFFPEAKVVFLNRDTADIWLSQVVFQAEQIESSEWTKTKNQIVAMGLNITEVDIDNWLQADKQTLETLSNVFEQELLKPETPKTDYWQKEFFEKSHWKNYKQYLEQ